MLCTSTHFTFLSCKFKYFSYFKNSQKLSLDIEKLHAIDVLVAPELMWKPKCHIEADVSRDVFWEATHYRICILVNSINKSLKSMFTSAYKFLKSQNPKWE